MPPFVNAPTGSKMIDIDPEQAKKTGYSIELILIHELVHACQHESGRRASLTDAEAEREAIDVANEYRESVGGDTRPYSEHDRISNLDIERWWENGKA